MPYTQEYFEKLESEKKFLIRFLFISAGCLAILMALYTIQQFQLRNQAHEIQQQRFEVALRNCEDTNGRRAETIKVLNRIIIKLHGKAKARAIKNESGTILLIDSLVPHRNCLELAKSVVSPKATKMP